MPAIHFYFPKTQYKLGHFHWQTSEYTFFILEATHLVMIVSLIEHQHFRSHSSTAAFSDFSWPRRRWWKQKATEFREYTRKHRGFTVMNKFLWLGCTVTRNSEDIVPFRHSSLQLCMHIVFLSPFHFLSKHTVLQDTAQIIRFHTLLIWFCNYFHI